MKIIIIVETFMTQIAFINNYNNFAQNRKETAFFISQLTQLDFPYFFSSFLGIH